MGRQAARALSNQVAAARVIDAFRPAPLLYTWSLIGKKFVFKLSDLFEKTSYAYRRFSKTMQQRDGTVRYVFSTSQIITNNFKILKTSFDLLTLMKTYADL